MTRKQIGEALEYSDPIRNISKVHERNADRLNPLSGVVSLTTPGGQQESFVYNIRGVMEICRLSRQPKADKFIDFVWNVIIFLMQGETVLAPVQQQQPALGSIPPSSYLSKMEHSPAKATHQGGS